MTADMETDVCIVGRDWPGSRRPGASARRVAPSWCSRHGTASGGGCGPRPAGTASRSQAACFVGSHDDRMLALTNEMGVTTFKTFVDGDNVLATGGKVRRYRGDIARISPVALLSAAPAIARHHERHGEEDPRRRPLGHAERRRLRRPCRCGRGFTPARFPDAPRPGPHCGDRPGLLRRRALPRCLFLNWLFLVRSAGGVELSLMNIAGGCPDSQFEGGVGQVPDAMAAELGEAVVLGTPVTGVASGNDRVEVRGSGCTVSAGRVVLALPRSLAAGIRFDPVLPGTRC